MIGRNFSREYCVILRKILRVLEALPLTADEVYSTRTAHGTLADSLQALSSNEVGARLGRAWGAWGL